MLPPVAALIWPFGATRAISARKTPFYLAAVGPTAAAVATRPAYGQSL